MLGHPKQTLVRLLRWSEQYLKTDMVYLAGGGFWLMFGYVTQVLSGLVLAVAFANLLPKETYGTYQFIMSVAGILGGCTLSGMGTALMRTTAQGHKGSLRYAFRTQLSWSKGVALASGLVSLYYFINQNATLALGFIIVGTLSPFISGFGLYRPYLEGKQLFRDSAVLGMWRRPLPVVAMLVAMFATDNPLILILTYFASQTISLGLVFDLVLRKYPEPAKENRELLNYSKHLSVMSFIGLIANNIDDIIIFHFLGPASVAVYSLAQLPSIHLHKIFGLAGTLIFPRFAQHEWRTLKASVYHKLRLYFLPVLAVTGVYALAAPYIFGLLFPSYTDAVPLSIVLVCTLLLKPATLFNQALAAHGVKGAQYIVQIGQSVVKVTLLVALVPLLGLWGAVWATVGMILFWALSLALLFYRRKES